jgi:NADH-quinone oxidoreductase subunit L
MFELIQYVVLFPLLGFLIIGLFGKYLKSEKIIGTLGSATVGISFLISTILFFNIISTNLKKPYIVDVFTWIATGDFAVKVSYQVDQLSILFSLIVTGVGFLIHVYSIGYMHGDRSFARFFAYLNLFIFMMLNLVLSSNFLLTFLGWEGVGLASYLLIGFWYDRQFPGVRITWTGDAANKAFIVNRIGDFGFLIAMFLIFTNFGTLSYTGVQDVAYLGKNIYYDSGLITAITLLLFLGCTGKSAQLPLAVWLPDAMAGPTPVSALIHAATMVTAGIFLIARNSVLFSLAPITMDVVLIVGVITAFWAATIGITQNDIKKVLAYSTVSQLGFMFAALGAGAYVAGVFHVMTHAFFKGLLFLGAGSVIHGMHEEQNIKKMGGLAKYMPVTYKTFLLASLAIAGVPFFSGFFSKDAILWEVYSNGGFLPWLILTIAAFFTAFYMFRLVYLVFFGNERFDHHKVHPHESPKTMTIPLIVLAFLSVFGGFLGVPYVLGFWFSHHPNLLENFLNPIFANAKNVLGVPLHHELHAIEYLFIAIAIAVALFAIKVAINYYKDEKLSRPRRLAEKFKSAYTLLWNKYYLDEIYFYLIVDPIVNGSRSLLWKKIDVAVVDGAVNGSAKVVASLAEFLRRLQTGIVQNYALLMIAGIAGILIWIVSGF